jgi:hypothetical protein
VILSASIAGSSQRLFPRISAIIRFLVLLFFAPLSLWAQLSTNDHLAEPGFWPTQNGASRAAYVGPAACAACHPTKADSQKLTPMGGTAIHAGDAGILHAHPKMNFAIGPYQYQIQTGAKGSTYTITDGVRKLTATLLWAFGTGLAAQSYLFKKEDGKFYEARVTFFDTLQNLQFTPARALASPKDLEEAMYRPVDAAEVGRCFACHMTASTIGDHFDEKNLIPGVSCEACHGPGAKHVAAMEAAKKTKLPDSSGTIFNSGRLGPVDSVDFCGACHGTWWDVKLSGITGPSSARSQPFRLEESRCWGKGDARLTCIACHDPHKQLQTEPSSYDANCLTCHLTAATEKKTAGHPGAACPVSTKNCTSCHMQKVFVPEMHFKFTDHRIRIARAGQPYPE